MPNTESLTEQEEQELGIDFGAKVLDRERIENYDCENRFTREEVERFTDDILRMVVESDYFDLMDTNDRSEIFCYLNISKKTMYCCHF